MRSRFFLPAALLALGGAVGWLAASGRLNEVFAQEKAPDKPELTPAQTATVLPVPPAPFKGQIAVRPKVLVAPYPTSSSRTSRMFGAPFGAWTGCGKSGFESFARTAICPLNGAGGTGSTVAV